MATTLRRTLILSLVVIVFLTLVGATYQGVATALERRQYPHPGRKIKAGTHQLHIYCTGDGSPTVVLEAPATGLSASWGWVQPGVAEETRVCSYDRAGLGWSEWGTTAFDPEAVPVQLRTLLSNAGEQGPFVLAGQGLGAALVQLTAARFADDVAGLVLIDAPVTAAEPTDVRRMARSATLSPWFARTGVLRVTRALGAADMEMPEPAAGMLRTFLARPDHLTRSARELARWNDTLSMADAAEMPGHVPLVRVTAAGPDRTAMLTDKTAADKATAAILSAVTAVRAAR